MFIPEIHWLLSETGYWASLWLNHHGPWCALYTRALPLRYHVLFASHSFFSCRRLGWQFYSVAWTCSFLFRKQLQTFLDWSVYHESLKCQSFAGQFLPERNPILIWTYAQEMEHPVWSFLNDLWSFSLFQDEASCICLWLVSHCRYWALVFFPNSSYSSPPHLVVFYLGEVFTSCNNLTAQSLWKTKCAEFAKPLCKAAFWSFSHFYGTSAPSQICCHLCGQKR